MTGDAPTRVVHIIPGDGHGGVETAARSMAERSSRDCFFRLIFIAGPTLAKDSERVICTGYRASLNPLAQLAALRACLALDPEVAIFSLWRSVPLLLAVRLVRPRVRLVFTVNLERSAHLVDRFAAWLATRVADEVWSDSAATLHRRALSTAANGRVISFVTDRLPEIEARAAPDLTFVAWSRLSPQKGLDRAIRLMAEFAAIDRPARFDVYGPDDGELTALTALAGQLGVTPQITFHGPVSRERLPEIARHACFFLLPSRMEGMAMACVEAMQLGLVPVVTPVGEMARYVVSGENGLLIDPDRLDAVVHEIVALVADPPRYAAMRRAAIDRWRSAPLYADEICVAARALADRPRGVTSRLTS